MGYSICHIKKVDKDSLKHCIKCRIKELDKLRKALKKYKIT